VRGAEDVNVNEVLALQPTFRPSAGVGLDGVRDSYLQKVFEVLAPVLALLFTVLLRLCCSVEVWDLARVTAVGKKGCIPDNLDTFRAISVLSRVARLYSKILEKRLRRVLPAFTPFQRAFLPGRGTQDGCALLQLAISFTLRHGGRLWAAFLDVRKAYPSACRRYLWAKLLTLGAPLRLVSAVRAVYTSARSVVCTRSGSSASYASENGLREGCVIAPLLWLVYICDLVDFVLGDIPADIAADLIKIADPSIPLRTWLALLLFADDLAVFAQSRAALQFLLCRIDAYCVDLGLTINTDPEKANGSCVVLFRSRFDRGFARVGSVLSQRTGGNRFTPVGVFVSGTLLPVREDFRYLGGLCHEFGCAEPVAADRNEKGYTAGRMLCTLAWTSPSMPYRNWTLALSALVGSVTLYLAEVWSSVLDFRVIDKSPQIVCLRSYFATRPGANAWAVLQVAGLFPWWVDAGTRALRYLSRHLGRPTLLGWLVNFAVTAALPLADGWLKFLREVWSDAYFADGDTGFVELQGVPDGWVEEWPQRARAAARARLARQLELLGRRGDSGLHWLGSSLAERGYLDLSPLLVAASGVRERRCIARFFLGTSNVQRVHANYGWRIPGLTAWGYDPENAEHKRACPHCMQRQILAWDSEPHVALACVATEEPRAAAQTAWREAGLDWPQGSGLAAFESLLCAALRSRRRPKQAAFILSRLIVESIRARQRGYDSIKRRWGARAARQRRRESSSDSASSSSDSGSTSS